MSQPDKQFINGLPTVSFVNAGSSNLYPTATYYDSRGRAIQIRQKGHIAGTYTITSNDYQIPNATQQNITTAVYNTSIKHKYLAANGTTQFITEKYKFSYDNFGRLSNREYSVGDVMAKHIVGNTYTPLGQLKQKTIKEGNTLLQTVDYRYNIRGWLTSINDPASVSNTGDLFGMNLYYNTTHQGIGNQPMYSGNISAAEWQTVQATGYTTPPTTGQKAYVYTYDELSRLTNASFKEIASGNWQQTSKFNEHIKGYDLNGNITGIIRRGSHSNWNTGLIDVLSYHYYGNQLIAVDDSIKTDYGYDFFDNNHSFNGAYREYEFDANGNITRDVNKGIIELTYNHLNLPRKISFSKLDFLEYLYDATGNKLRQVEYKQSNINKTTDFISNFVIVNNAPAWINFDEGRVIMDGTNVYFTETHLKDHLGNTRVVFGYKNNALLVKQVSSYYPFGMNIKGLTTQVTIEEAKHPANEYLYNGKMFQDELGLDWLDYGARMYDAVLGRFPSIDPIASDFSHVTPYNYAENKVINCIDLWGLQAVQVTFGGRGALPIYGPWGISMAFEIGLTVDKNLDLVIQNTTSTGISYGGAISVGYNGTFYPTANSYKDVMGNGVDFGYSGPILFNKFALQGNLTFPSDGIKFGGTLSLGLPKISAGSAFYIDFTMTNQMSEPTNIYKSSSYNQIAQRMGISKQQANLILLMMLSKIQENKKIELPEVTISAERPQQKVGVHQQYMRQWMDSKVHPDRLYPGDFGYTSSYWAVYDYTKNFRAPK